MRKIPRPRGLIILALCGSLLFMATNPNVDHRRSERHPVRMAILLLADPIETESQNEVYTVDLSQHGCRIEGSASLTQGQLVQLIPSETSGATITGRVVWVGAPASDLAGEAGIELIQPLTSPV